MTSAPPFRILTVDDQASVRALLRELLEAEGVALEEAATTDEALAAVRKQKPDVIFLDIVFEEEERWGYELCTQLHELAPDVPIIGLSSRSRPVDRQMMERKGAAAYLTKKDVTSSQTTGRALLIETVKRLCPKAATLWTS